MTEPPAAASPVRPLLIFTAGAAAGFLGAGSFASSVIGLAIFLGSLFIAVFLATLAHGLLADRPDGETPSGGETQSPVGSPSI